MKIIKNKVKYFMTCQALVIINKYRLFQIHIYKIPQIQYTQQSSQHIKLYIFAKNALELNSIKYTQTIKKNIQIYLRESLIILFTKKQKNMKNDDSNQPIINISSLIENSTYKEAIRRKPINQKTGRIVKFKHRQQYDQKTSKNKTNKSKNLHTPQLKNSSSQKIRLQENNSIIQANVSAIQGSSFISNKQDGSMDSMDQIIIGVGLDQKSFQEGEHEIKDNQNSDNQQESRSSRLEIDFNQINQQYQQLFDRKKLLGQDEQYQSNNNTSGNMTNNSQEDQQKLSNYSLEKNYSHSLSNYHHNSSILSYSMLSRKRNQNNDLIRSNLQKMQLKVEEVKNSRKMQDLSNNSIKLLASNLSEIHEEREHHPNNSIDTDHKVANCEEDEEDFYDFVSQPDPQQPLANKQNKKVNSFERDQQWQQQSPMLQLLLLRDKYFNTKDQQKPQNLENLNKKNLNSLENYKPILEALNSKQQDYIQTKQSPTDNIEYILKLRQQWIYKKIKNNQKTQTWKTRQLKILSKIRCILQDYQYDDDEIEQSAQKVLNYNKKQTQNTFSLT